MTEHRDDLVRDALQQLDVPEHRPGFWERLEVRLAGEHRARVAEGDREERRREAAVPWTAIARWLPLIIAMLIVLVVVIIVIAA